MNYKVLKPFYTHTEKQNFNVGDVINLTKERAESLLNEGYIETTKEKEATAKEKPQTKDVEKVSFTTSTKQKDND
ncbi:MAG: hypothetical protein RLZZ605_1443 [Bacteroidota bacterium]|jgi:hypothetical protein